MIVTKKPFAEVSVSLTRGIISFVGMVDEDGATRKAMIHVDAKGHNYKEMCRTILDGEIFEIAEGSYRPAPDNGLSVRPEGLIIRG